MKPKHGNSDFSSYSGWVAICMSVAALTIAMSGFSPAQAQPLASVDSCGKRIFSDISPDTAKRAGMVATSDGLYELNMDKLAATAGGPVHLLRLSRQQHASNLHWLSAMERLVADPDTPVLPEVQAVYQQGWETNVVEMSIIHAMECQLGLPLSDLTLPKSPATTLAEREARIAQARADEQARVEADARRQANQAGINKALSGLANVLGAAASALGSSSSSGGRMGGGDCPWDGHDYSCETAPGY